MDMEKMQKDLNAFLQKKYGKDVNVSISARLVPLDKLDILQKEVDPKEKDKK